MARRQGQESATNNSTDEGAAQQNELEHTAIQVRIPGLLKVKLLPVTPFSGKQFRQWREAIADSLAIAGISEALESNGAELIKAKYPDDPEAWMKANAATKSLVWNGLDTSIQTRCGHLRNNIPELLKELENAYGRTDVNRQVALQKELFGKARSMYPSHQEYIEEKLSIFSEMQACGREVTEAEKCRTLIELMDGTEFEIFRAAELCRDASIHGLVNRILALPDPKRNLGAAMSVKKPQFRCARCATNDHSYRRCPVSKCFKCNQPGHIAKDCKEIKGNEKYWGPWIVDSGASISITPDERDFCYLEKGNYGEVKTAGGERHQVLGMGRVVINNWTLDNVGWVPTMAHKLISVCDEGRRGTVFTFGKENCRISKGSIEQEAEIGPHGLYEIVPEPQQALMTRREDVKVIGDSLNNWHQRMGHLNHDAITRLFEEGLISGGKLTDRLKMDCEACQLGKAHCPNHDREAEREPTEVGELISADMIISPREVPGNGGETCALLIMDNFSGFTSVTPLVRKNAESALQCIKNFVEYIENKTGNKVKYFRTDNGTEFDNKRVSEYLAEKGITHEKTAPYTSKGNGRAERMIRTLKESTNAMLIQSGLPESYWSFAIRMASFNHNRTGRSPFLQSKTPFELIYGYKPDVKQLRAFGEKCYAKFDDNPDWRSKAEEGQIIGYGDRSECYHVLLKNGAFKESRNVSFPSRTRELARRSTSTSVQTEESSHDETVEDQVKMAAERLRERKEYIVASAAGVIPEERDEPTLREALSGPRAAQWKKAIEEEMGKMIEMGVVEEATNTNGKTPIDTKLILKAKRDSAGEIKLLKARLVAKGYNQVFGRDFDDTFAPVCRSSTVRVALAWAAMNGYKAFQADVKSAYLNAPLKEELYIRIPSIEENEGSKTYRLRKALYGLKQSGHEWHKTLKAALGSKGWQSTLSEACVFVRERNNHTQLMTVYVDDLLVLAKDEEEYAEIIKELREHFEVSELGEVRDLLGMNIIRKDNLFLIDQSGLIRRALDNFKHSIPIVIAATPIAGRTEPYEGKAKPEEIRLYQQCIGTLNHIAQWTRPDIAAAVSIAAQHTANPGPQDFKALGRILGYLLYTVDYRLRLGGNKSTQLTIFTDSDWAGDQEDRKSQSGYVAQFGQSTVSWSSRKQKSVSRSSMEAEYIAMADGLAEGIYLKQFLGELRIDCETINMLGDNQAAQAISNNPCNHSRAKHIDIGHHFVREWVQDGRATTTYVQSKDNPADIMTKGVPKPAHSKAVETIGIGPWGSVEKEVVQSR